MYFRSKALPKFADDKTRAIFELYNDIAIFGNTEAKDKMWCARLSSISANHSNHLVYFILMHYRGYSIFHYVFVIVNNFLRKYFSIPSLLNIVKS